MTLEHAQKRAKACFAVARSATFPAERAAAIGRGLAICEKAGLDPDDFDIPGRDRSRCESRWSDAGMFSGPQYTSDESTRLIHAFRRHMAEGSAFRRTMEEFGYTLDRVAAAAGAREGETPYDARRRNFDQATAAARARDAAREGRS